MTDDAIPNVSFRRLRAVFALRETTLAEVAKKIDCTPSHLRFVLLGQRASSARLRAKLLRELHDHEWRFVRCEIDELRDTATLPPDGDSGVSPSASTTNSKEK